MHNSSIIRIINDFSRQLFLIKTPTDFNKGLNEAFQKAVPDISKYIFFRYHWEDNLFSIVSSNCLDHIDTLPVDTTRLQEFLLGLIQKDILIFSENIAMHRDNEILSSLNNASSGSELMFPMIPVNDAVGVLYMYSEQADFFNDEKTETFRLLGNMISRAWNMILYQAHQIKGHKKAELEIVHQKSLMNEIFDYLPINIYTKNREGKFIYVNKNTTETTGISLEDTIGKTAFEIYPEAFAKKTEQEDEEVRKTKKPILNQHEIEVNGNAKFFFTGKKMIHTKQNEELLIGFSVDISENVLASKAIEDQKKFYEQILNTVPNYIYVKDKNGKFLLVNDTYAEMFGLSQKQILSEGINSSTKAKIDVTLNDEMDQRILDSRESLEMDESIILKNGVEKWFHTTKKPLPGKDGVVNILGISVDITDRKKYSDELIKAKQTKELFLANMSHEIRTPINGIVGMINLLEEIPATEEQKKYLHAIKTSSNNLQVIINDILDLSAVESGNIKFERIEFNLKSFFHTLISSFNYAAKQKGISITLNLDPYIDDVVIGDPVRLNQIMSNLIGNAVKFTKQGGVKVYALKLSQKYNIGHFQFIVDDSGIGISEDKMEKIFENFEQGDAAINRKYGGTGLGLAIVKQLVEAQNGSIQLKSKLGRGTIFTIDLDIEIGNETSDDSSDSDTTAETIDRPLDLSKHKLLLVEDNEVNMLYTKKILLNWHCTPDSAKNGLIALEMLKENYYDLILMDVRMPTMDGFEATKFIRANFNPPKSTTPIIALTANAIKGDDEKCFEAGMNDYISKPFHPGTLKNILISNMDLEGFTNKVNPSKSMKPHNQVTDLTYLTEMSDNDQNFITDMIRSFISQSPKDLEQIRHHFDDQDFEEVANLIHKMKPSITFMGIHELKDLVLEVEENAKKNEIALLKNQLDKFEYVCQNAVKELVKKLNS